MRTTTDSSPTMHITVKELYNNIINSYREVVWESPESHIITAYAKMLEHVARHNIEEIRQMFKDGETPMLIGSDMGILEEINKRNTAEIRIYKGTSDNVYENLIGVIINPEINY